MDDNVEKQIATRVAKVEEEYRNHFNTLQEQVFSQVKKYLSESIIANKNNPPELEAEVSTYRPVIETIVRTLKESGILNKSESVNINEAVTIIEELTEAVSDQTRKIEDLKRMLKIHEMINKHMSGIDKTIINEAIKHFQGEDLNDDELSDKLIEFVAKRKPGTKAVQFENISSELDDVDSILESKSVKSISDKFSPKKKIDIKGLKKRVVTESAGLHLKENDGPVNEVEEFMNEFGHIR